MFSIRDRSIICAGSNRLTEYKTLIESSCSIIFLINKIITVSTKSSILDVPIVISFSTSPNLVITKSNT